MIKNLFIKLCRLLLLILIYIIHPFIWIPTKIFALILLLILYVGAALAYIPTTINLFSSYLKYKKVVLINKIFKT